MEIKGSGSSNTYVPPSSSGTLMRRSEIELVMREREKKRIREEILMKEEILRRRELEKEVIRDLMLEGKIPIQRLESLPVLPSQSFPMGPQMRGPLLNPHEGNQTENGAFRLFPFQRDPKATTASNGKPVFNLCKDEPMHLVKPVSNVPTAGTKRKFESITENCEEPRLATKAQKKPLVDWSCSLCKVKTTSEDHLKAHLNGKKHKAKESASIRAQTKATTARETAACAQPQATNAKMAEKAAMELDQPPSTNASKGPAVDELVEIPTATASEFWCTMCNFAATSEAEMNAHKRGNAHLWRFMQNGGYLTTIEPVLDMMTI